MDQLFIYFPAGRDPGGGKKWGPDLGRMGPDGLNQPGEKKWGSAREGPKNDPKSKKTVTFIGKTAHFEVKFGPGPGEAQARSRPALAWPRPGLGRPGAQIGYPFFPRFIFVPDSFFNPGKRKWGHIYIYIYILERGGGTRTRDANFLREGRGRLGRSVLCT